MGGIKDVGTEVVMPGGIKGKVTSIVLEVKDKIRSNHITIVDENNNTTYITIRG
jgi:preprotein translocase subunit YajC